MKFNIKTTGLSLREDLEDYVNKRIESLEKFSKKFGSSVEFWVELAKTTGHHKEGSVYRAEISVRVPGKVLRAEAQEKDIYRAIDEARDDIERQLKERRGKLFSRFKRGARLLKEILRFGRFKK
ncbi:MAG: ribosome hibernation-promoting factor, HPF/YfiA family [Candidatus Paceibacteria bacterium]